MSGAVVEADLRAQLADEASIEAMTRVEALARHVVAEAEKILTDLFRANALRNGQALQPPAEWALVGSRLSQ